MHLTQMTAKYKPRRDPNNNKASANCETMEIFSKYIDRTTRKQDETIDSALIDSHFLCYLTY